MSSSIFQRVRVVVLLAAIGLVLAACKSDTEKVADFLELGDEYAEQGQDREAVIEYRIVLQVAPNDPAAHWGLAQAYLRLGRLKDGYWELRESVRLDPENLDARQRFGEVSALARDFDEATIQADILLEAKPDSGDAHLLKGAALEGSGEVDAAEAHYLKAIELVPDKPTLNLDLARYYVRVKKIDLAEKSLLAYTEGDSSARSFVQLGQFYLANDRVEDAENALKMAIEKNDDRQSQPYIALASLYRQQDRGDEAVAILESGIGSTERDSLLYYELARLFANRGDEQRADDLIQQATEADPDDPKGFLVLSRYRSSLGDSAGALEAIEQALAIDPEDTIVILRKAELLTDTGYQEKNYEKLQEARALADAVLEEEVSNANALFVRAKIEMADGSPESAILSLRAAINTRPNWAEAHFILGSALVLTGDSSGARIELSRALELNPDITEARRLLATIHAELGEHEYAIEQGRRFLDSGESAPQMRIQVAQSLLRLGKFKEAYEELQKIPEEEMGPEANFALGRMQMARGEFDEARASMMQANAEAPNQPEVLRALIRLDQATGRLDESVARIEEALAQNPDSGSLMQIRGEVALIQGDRVHAEKSLKQAVELDPQDVEALQLLAGFYQLGGQVPEMVDALERASNIRPDDARIHQTLGILYESQGDKGRAIESYEKAILYEPDLGEAKNNLAYLLVETGGALDRALELAQDAKALLPDDPNAADTLGWVLYKRGVSSAAVGYLREAVDRMPPGSPSLSEVRFHLAMAYEALKEEESAIESLDAALGELEERRKQAKAAGRELASPAWEKEAREARDRLATPPTG